MMSAQPDDVFTSTESRPTVKLPNKGDSAVLYVTGYPEMVHGNDYEDATKKAYYPPNDDGTQNPIMSAVTVGNLGSQDGEPVALWATKSRAPGSMFTAITACQKATGRIAPGSILKVTFSDTTPAKNPRHKPRHLFTVEHKPNAFVPAAGAPVDAFDAPATAPAADKPAAPAIDDPWGMGKQPGF